MKSAKTVRRERIATLERLRDQLEAICQRTDSARDLPPAARQLREVSRELEDLTREAERESGTGESATGPTGLDRLYERRKAG